MTDINNISLELMRECIGNPDKEKALALVIRFKAKFRSSVMKDYSIRRLAEAMGISVNTCRKRLATAIDMGLMTRWERDGIQFLKARKLRTLKAYSKRARTYYSLRYFDIKCDGIARNADGGLASLNEIQLGIRTLVICDVVRRKGCTKQLILDGTNPGRNVKTETFRKQRQKVLDRLGSLNINYEDFGITYDRLQRKTGYGRHTIKRMGDYGMNKEWFIKIKPLHTLVAVMESTSNVNHYTFPYKYTYKTKHTVMLVNPCLYLSYQLNKEFPI